MTIDGALVIGDARAIGGADFSQARAARGHYVGDAKAVADFDEFAAGDDDFGVFGECIEHEKNGGGVVVHNDGGFRAGDFREQAVGVRVALAARAGGDVVFEI